MESKFKAVSENSSDSFVSIDSGDLKQQVKDPKYNKKVNKSHNNFIVEKKEKTYFKDEEDNYDKFGFNEGPNFMSNNFKDIEFDDDEDYSNNKQALIFD